MTEQAYRQLIIKGIQGLPLEVLAEIADFIYFLRKRALQPQTFEEERQNSLLGEELKQLSRNAEAHLEKEFEDYDHVYPRYVEGG
jgi:hypothetical protein